MLPVVSFLAAPFVLTVLLVAIHAYLGLHVLEREVVFVDISLSQIAALGGGLGLFFSRNEENPYSLWYSLGLCLFVSFLLSVFRKYEKKISQEAIIGVTYAFASGMLILLMDRLPHGIEHIKTALIGNILFVTWSEVIQTTLIYLVIGLIHYVFRHQFWMNSRSKNKKFVWDLLFYFLFGVVITFSTHHAGVLVVFSILIVPASLSLRYFETIKNRLLFSWGFGVISSFIAFIIIYYFDLPAGAGIVATITTLFFIFLLFSLAIDFKNRPARELS